VIALSTTNIDLHADLIEACKRGDRMAQSRLYQLYNRAMYNICTRMLGDPAAAEDALQEAFVNAFRKLHLFEGRSSFGAWLKRIVINKCLSMLNKKQMFTEPIDERTMQEPDHGNRGEAYHIDLSPNQVHQAIKSLPEGCRVVFTLYQLEGYDHQEIADILDVSISTSKSQFHRAKKLLRERLSKEMAGGQ
jgi:RNA polymerase sigma-70 factor (ECF subfamily)